MNVILHGPASSKEEKELAKQIAEIHGDYILRFLENLDCPQEQKKQIIEGIKKRHRNISSA